MIPRTALIVALLTLCFAPWVAAERTEIPQHTVIAVQQVDEINSDLTRVGDKFTAKCMSEVQSGCGGFPDGTVFTGEVVCVANRGLDQYGYIGVKFVEAELPNGMEVPINGRLISLDCNDTVIDPNSGMMRARNERALVDRLFIGYGERNALVIGSASGNCLTGAQIRPQPVFVSNLVMTRGCFRSVDVTPGTCYGIMLMQYVAYGEPVGAGPKVEEPKPAKPMPAKPEPKVTETPAKPGRGPRTVDFSSACAIQKPIRTGAGVLMVPFSLAARQLGIPYTYDNRSKILVTSSSQGRVTHRAGTRTATVGGTTVRLPASSRIIGKRLFVPSEVIKVVTGGDSVMWDRSSEVLTIR